VTTTTTTAEVSSYSSFFSQQPNLSSSLLATTSSSILHKRCKSTSTKTLSSSSLSSSNKGGTKISGNDAPTLFGLPNLRQPTDFIRLAHDAIRECNTVRYALASSLSSPPPSSSVTAVQQAKLTLHRIDDISNIVCTVIDAAELCRSVHASNAWRQAANDAFGILSEYIGNLNADASIYKSLLHYVFADNDDDDANTNTTTNSGGSSGGIILSALPQEYRRMAIAMRREFERDGIHLQYTERETARELNNVIVGLESLFTSNITSRIKYYDITDESGMINEVDRIIPRHILGQLVRCPSTQQSSGVGSSSGSGSRLTLSSDNLLCNTLLAHSPSSALRKEIYMQSNTSVPENINVLDALIKHRHIHSTLLGYPSYAHRVLSDRMVGSPEKVMQFLCNMENRAKHVHKTDMELIASTKRYMEGSSGSGNVVEPWDIPYYTTLLKAQRQHQRWTEAKDDDTDDTNDSRDYDESSQFARYFTVENSIEGMKVLVQELFNITMEEVSIPMEERWDVADTTTVKENNISCGGGLRKFIFHHDEDGTLGTMFFDLHPRDGKFLHAAHFTIRCGRRRNEEEDSMLGGGESSGDHQLPIVALVCNLSPSSSEESSSSSTSSQTQLSHAEVETLYHEFGHGLHSMLSRTSFQHLSGTRAAMDYVETPSHLFESFARDPCFLSRVLAKHYVTGQPMSIKRAQHLSLSNLDFRGIEIQTQIVHSKFDQALFGIHPCSVLLGGQSSTEVFERLHRDAGIPYASGTHWHSRFGHLVTYGAGYYGYLYAQTFAADIWTSTLASTTSGVSGTVRRDGGMKIWKEMLIHGGAKDPKEMIHAVLGREPSVDPFFTGIA
jgi:intermediate peptidase